MSGLRQTFRPLLDSHAIGLIVAVLAFVGMSDVAAVATSIPGHLGFGWQAGLVMASPLLCVFVCLIVSNLAPVGNSSRNRAFRTVGRIPVLGRYLVFVSIGLGTVLLGVVGLHFLTSSSIQSLKLRGNVPTDAWVRVYTDVGEGVVFRGTGGETEVFFLEEKRAAVERALDMEGLAAEE